MSKRRRPRGSGGVRQRKDGSYEIYYRPRPGAKQIFERAGLAEQKAWELLDLRNAQRHQRSGIAMQGVSFEDVPLEWLDMKRGQVRDSTYAKYAHSVHYHLIPAFGDDPIGALTAREWRQWQAGKLNGN